MKRRADTLGVWGLAAALLLAILAQGMLLHAETAAAAQAKGGEDADVVFRWAFGVLSRVGEEEKIEPVRQDRTMKSGDQFKMMVELQTRCFVYLLRQDARGSLKLHFPYTLQQFASDYEVGRKYVIPAGNERFTVDNSPGRDTFHLLASIERLSTVENLWTQYESADPAHKLEIAKMILAEIREIKRRNRELASASVERPVAIGGNIRGVKQPEKLDLNDLSTIADEISATGFYGKAFTIEHQ